MMQPSKVYFTDFRCRVGVSQQMKLEKLLLAAGFDQIDFEGKFVAIKLHFGELGNLAFLRPNYAKTVADMVKARGGMPFLTDCNTLYVGSRKHALEHMDTAYINGYSPFSTGCHVIIADGLKGSDDVEVPVEGGEYVKHAKIGRALMDADIVISLTHFKGHAMAGFGGAIKNISIGLASRTGKCLIHSAGKSRTNPWGGVQDHFLESMGEAGKSVSDALGQGARIAYINVMNRLSVDCDCDAHPEEPKMGDIGILASIDPVALDKACVDLVYASPDAGKVHLIERMESRHGIHTLEHGEAIGLGSQQYELVELK